MLQSCLFASLIALALATALLVCPGSRLRDASVELSALVGLCFVGVVAVGVRTLWHLPWHDAVAGALRRCGHCRRLKVGRFVRFDPGTLNVWLEQQRVDPSDASSLRCARRR
jgi:hypothetical protein